MTDEREINESEFDIFEDTFKSDEDSVLNDAIKPIFKGNPKFIDQEKYDQLNKKYISLAADFDNYKKRTSRDYEATVKNANKKLILDLLVVADNLENALSSNISEEDRKGYELILKSLEDTLIKYNCEKIDTRLATAFDVFKHEAVFTKATNPGDEFLQSGNICAIIQSGWTLNGEVIRPTKVGVWS